MTARQKMTRMHDHHCPRVLALATLFALSIHSAFAQTQTYPTRPIRIVAAEAGSTNDLVARLLAPGLTARLGYQAIVDNRGGAGVIAPEIVAKAVPDGHTLLLNGSNLWLAQYLRSHVPYSMNDFV